MTGRKVATIVGTLLGIGLATLVAANAVDYWRFHSAIRRVESLTDEQFRALADAAKKVKPREIISNPPGFEVLKALEGSMLSGHADFSLYRLKAWKPRDDYNYIYLNLWITTSAHNQQILYFTNAAGPQRTKILWNRNPEFFREYTPTDRILTIDQWGLHGGASWIVLKDRILVIEKPGRSGSEPTIVGRASLDAAGLARIKEALAKLPATARGKDYRADGVADGVTLNINFQPDGESGENDVSISNVWVPEFGPLLTTVSELSPKDCPIKFIDWVQHEEALTGTPTPSDATTVDLGEIPFVMSGRGHAMTVRTRAEWEKIYYGKPDLPWWCLWRWWWS